ncbi:S-adenosyl-L-methionine-dependent methyltransferase [Martensiomyces pterosporus]|nr:S-adenosyl-L-methionine-dependent methyltransferase [Martensiomyces pterosporus]
MAERNGRIRCLEFFSGIGGLHYGFQESQVDGEVVMSFDMNENANRVYEHNFRMRPNNKAIDYLVPRDIERHDANCWLLSPPCQPYTRGGKYLDDEDPRARGLVHLLELLPKLDKVPSYLFLENVMNFENSRSRRLAVETLGHLGFEIHECLISPVQLGIPNNRLRYFLIACRRWPAPSSRPGDGDSGTTEAWLAENKKRTAEYLARGRDSMAGVEIPKIPLAQYIDPAQNGDRALWVPERAIMKRKNLEFDIVRPLDTQTSTFTKAYGSKHLIGSGSLLQTKNLDVVENGFGSPEKLLDLGLRFFSPKEVALLHHFPFHNPHPTSDDGDAGKEEEEKGGASAKRARHARYMLEFPTGITQQQQLKLLGNSLNVKVVAELLKHILFAEPPVETSNKQ